MYLFRYYRNMIVYISCAFPLRMCGKLCKGAGLNVLTEMPRLSAISSLCIPSRLPTMSSTSRELAGRLSIIFHSFASTFTALLTSRRHSPRDACLVKPGDLTILTRRSSVLWCQGSRSAPFDRDIVSWQVSGHHSIFQKLGETIHDNILCRIYVFQCSAWNTCRAS